MRSRTLGAASATTAFTLAFTAPAGAGAIIFDSLDGAYSFPASTIFGPPLAATFTTGPSAVRVDVALSLSSIHLDGPDPGDTYTVSPDGGIPLSDLTFDPINGLMSVDDSFIQAWKPVIDPVTLPLTSLQSVLTVERYDQFSAVSLNPNSLYWIEVSSGGGGDTGVAWGVTRDVSGPGVASNYLESNLTNEAFFLNKGVDPWPSDDAFQMEIATVPEPSTWLMMALGFAGLGFFARSAARGPRSA
jgi:PEP-CTERM motif